MNTIYAIVLCITGIPAPAPPCRVILPITATLMETVDNPDHLSPLNVCRMIAKNFPSEGDYQYRCMAMNVPAWLVVR